MTWQDRHFDWNHAKAFLITAEQGSFSAAAKVLKITQPTLGRQVSALEMQLGATLFERSARGLLLTPSGHELLVYVRAMQEAAEKLYMAAGSHAKSLVGKVSISASESAAAHILPPVLSKLHQQAPGIQIELLATNESSDLLRREADIALRSYRPTQPDLIARKLRDERAHLYGAKSYLQKFSRRSVPADLNQADFMAFEHSTIMQDELKKRGFTLTAANFPFVVANHLVQWQLVKQGAGLGFMVEDVGDNEPLVERALPGMPAYDVELWLVIHRELHTSARLRLVFDFLVEQLGQ
ncbi:LysR family transcriptional regulator [Bowmanella denitrificans]|uniref:LysR family transcriptional regulator n=1 Tax=Bowmanella denitrificans TaxID=366582 RepID=A0ABN0XM82_9ALTE